MVGVNFLKCDQRPLARSLQRATLVPESHRFKWANAMSRIAFTAASSVSLAVSAHSFGAVLTVTALTVDAPHTVTASTTPGHSSKIRLGGAVGPASGASDMFITVTLDFDFVESVIAGDSLSSFLRVRPDFESGQFSATEIRLTASVYDDGDLVWGVMGEPFEPLQSIGDGVLRSFEIFTDTFEGPGPAFSTIGDGGHGRLAATFQWSGFNAGDQLSIDFAPGGASSTIQYWNFIPAPGSGAALLGAAAFAARRRR